MIKRLSTFLLFIVLKLVQACETGRSGISCRWVERISTKCSIYWQIQRGPNTTTRNRCWRQQLRLSSSTLYHHPIYSQSDFVCSHNPSSHWRCDFYFERSHTVTPPPYQPSFLIRIFCSTIRSYNSSLFELGNHLRLYRSISLGSNKQCFLALLSLALPSWQHCWCFFRLSSVPPFSNFLRSLLTPVLSFRCS